MIIIIIIIMLLLLIIILLLIIKNIHNLTWNGHSVLASGRFLACKGAMHSVVTSSQWAVQPYSR